MWRITLVVMVGCASRTAPIAAPVSAAPIATAVAEPVAAPAKAADPPHVPRRVAVLMLGIPYGDINAPAYAEDLTHRLRDLASANDTLVPVASDAEVCEADERDCAAAIAKRSGADVIVYGILIHSTEGGSIEIHLASLANDTVRTWDGNPLDSDGFRQRAMEDAYGALVAP
jgi:hypothetical protein